MKKIELYRIRTYSEIFEDSILWLKENRHAVLRYIAPVAVVSVLILATTFFGAYIKSSSDYETYFYEEVFTTTIIVSIISLWLTLILFYSLFLLYHQRENGLKNLTFKQLIIAMITVNRHMAVMVVVVAISLILFILLSEFLAPFYIIIILIAAFAVPALFIYPAVVGMNNKGHIEHLKETIALTKYGFGTIAKITASLFVFCIALVALSFTSVGAILLLENYLPDSLQHGEGKKMAEYSLYFITFFLFAASIYFLYLLTLVFAVHTYGSLKETKEAVSIDEKIDNFENL